MTPEELDAWVAKRLGKQQEADDGDEKRNDAERQRAEQPVEVLQEEANTALDNFRETHSEAQQRFIADTFVETGEVLTGEQFGITEAQANAVTQGYIATMERDVFSHYGITHEQWMEHVDPDELADFRRDAIGGNWSTFHQHAAQAAAMRKSLGLPMGRKAPGPSSRHR